MTSHSRFTVWCVALVLGCLCGASASAHESSAKSRPDGAETHPASVSASSDIPWDTIEWTERRYKIEALGFKAREETGIHWWGSDEVMIATGDAKGWTVSDEIGSVDSGETHKLDPTRSCIVSVRSGIVVLGKTSVCDDIGVPAPLWFEVEFWEKDSFGLGDAFCVLGQPSPGHHAGPHCVTDGGGDDFIARTRIDLTGQDLDAVLPNIGDEHIETVVLFPCNSGSTCSRSDPPEYSVIYRITRLPDVRVGLRSVLDEAMRKIGARSELDAIAAGLRSLRTPSPRQVEPDLPK